MGRRERQAQDSFNLVKEGHALTLLLWPLDRSATLSFVWLLLYFCCLSLKDTKAVSQHQSPILLYFTLMLRYKVANYLLQKGDSRKRDRRKTSTDEKGTCGRWEEHQRPQLDASVISSLTSHEASGRALYLLSYILQGFYGYYFKWISSPCWVAKNQLQFCANQKRLHYQCKAGRLGCTNQLVFQDKSYTLEVPHSTNTAT